MRVIGAVAIALLFLLPPPVAVAQEQDPLPELVFGKELERYLRTLQLTGAVPSHPWSLRDFSPEVIERVGSPELPHPWADRLAEDTAAAGLRPIRTDARLIFNSAFPFGSDEGPVWAGRGLTGFVRGGAVWRRGPVTLTVAPVVHFSQNVDFAMMPHSFIRPGEFLDGRHPRNIDLPQRFGDGAYVKADPGESTLRIDERGVAAGISTGTQFWGPAVHHPLILGDNAAGFPNAFLETSRPANIGIGRIQARIFWGRLGQSAYSPVSGDSTARFATGLVAVFQPAIAPNLEIGGGRFFHTPWTPEGLRLSNFTKTFEGFLKAGIPGKDVIPDENEPDRPFDPDNQIASVFFRWLLPGSGFELYGELARDDHSWDARDLALEPDHSLGFMLGFGKAWTLASGNVLAARGEWLDTQITTLDQVRPQAPFYVHGWTRQGHTNDGQLLGSPAGYGGAASVLEFDYYHPLGRWSAGWSRELRQTSDRYWLDLPIDERGVDVVHALAVEVVRFQGAWDVTGGATIAYNFNRNFAGDELNFRLHAGVRAPL